MKSVAAGTLVVEYPNPNDKYSGWLKKLGGKLKIWKERFYVLTGTHLQYYTGADRKKLLGEFPLESAFVESDTTNVDFSEDKSCVFIIKFGKNDKLGCATPSPTQQIILCAPSVVERKLWIRAIRKILYLDKGGALFGTHLNEVFFFTTKENNYLPRVVYDTVNFIRNYGLKTEGIFRKCGKHESIRKLADVYDIATSGKILDPNLHDLHLISGLLKYYLRELPEPVIPFSYYELLKEAGYRIADGQGINEFVALFHKIPPPNYNMLKYLCEFLHEVSQYEAYNRMSIANLASVIAPNILRQEIKDPVIEMAAAVSINSTVSEFIRIYDVLFPYPMKSHFDCKIQFHCPTTTTTNINSNNTKFNNNNNSSSNIPSYDNHIIIESIIDNSEKQIIQRHPIRQQLTKSYSMNRKFDNNNNNQLEYGSTYENSPVTLMKNVQNTDIDNWQISELCKGKHLQNNPNSNLATVQLKPHQIQDLASHLVNRPKPIFRSVGQRKHLRKLQAISGEYEVGSSISNSEEDLCRIGLDTSIREQSISANRPTARPRQFGHRYDHSPNNVHIGGVKQSINYQMVNDNCDWSNSKIRNNNNNRPVQPVINIPLSNDPTTDTNRYNNNNISRQHYSPNEWSSEQNTFHNHQSLLNNPQWYDETADKTLTPRIDKTGPQHQTHTDLLQRANEEIRYWRSVANTAQANAVGEAARAEKLMHDLARLQASLNMSNMENVLLRQNLASLQTELRAIYHDPNEDNDLPDLRKQQI